MLTGEWGCGKTYLLNNQLRNEFKDTHIFLRISLFGMSSIEEIKNDVKQKWLYAIAESKDISGKTAENIEKVGGALKNISEKAANILPEPAKNIVGGLLSINALDFVKVNSTLGGKTVVLIFDDLERANISTTDLLGCINDYCENMGFHTIVVANEEKLHGMDDEKIKYEEIKEKIIQRTIHHAPEYKHIVSNVIADMKFKSEAYKNLLLKCSDDITIIFSGKTLDGKSLDEFVERCDKGSNYHDIEKENQRIENLLKKRPHNIRSLKCALQDFNRVYDLLEEYEIPDIDKWLFSFITFVFTCRAGLIEKDDRYGYLLSVKNIEKLYPGYFNEKNISSGIKSWIINGEWDEENIVSQVKFAKERYMAISPVEKARTYRIFELEEVDVTEGYPELLAKAYDGKIELNDYINLLCNSCWARTYNINIPVINWDKIQIGVEKKILELLQSHTEPSHCRTVIGEENRENYSDEEWKIYETIKKYQEGDKQIFENNRNLFIKLMNEDPYKAYEEIKNKRLDCFTTDMANATLQAFKTALNASKNDIVTYFRNIIKAMINSPDFKTADTSEGLLALKNGLEEYEKLCISENASIAACHTRYFIKVINDINIEEL